MTNLLYLEMLRYVQLNFHHVVRISSSHWKNILFLKAILGNSFYCH